MQSQRMRGLAIWVWGSGSETHALIDIGSPRLAYLRAAGITEEMDAMDAGSICEGLVHSTFWKQEGIIYSLKNPDGTTLSSPGWTIDNQYWCTTCDLPLFYQDLGRDGRGWSCESSRHWGCWRRNDITTLNIAANFGQTDARRLDVTLSAGTDTNHLLNSGNGGSGGSRPLQWICWSRLKDSSRGTYQTSESVSLPQ